MEIDSVGFWSPVRFGLGDFYCCTVFTIFCDMFRSILWSSSSSGSWFLDLVLLVSLWKPILRFLKADPGENMSFSASQPPNHLENLSSFYFGRKSQFEVRCCQCPWPKEHKFSRNFACSLFLIGWQNEEVSFCLFNTLPVLITLLLITISFLCVLRRLEWVNTPCMVHILL